MSLFRPRGVRLLGGCLLLAAGSAVLAQSSVGEQPSGADPQQPRMRPVDRDWAWFAEIPCEEIDRTVFHSRSEEMLLARRKSECLQRYKAFLPEPLEQAPR